MFYIRSALLPLLALLTLLVAAPAAAQAPRVPPVFDQLASPFTDGETGGIGCLAVSAVTAAVMVALVGGPSVLRSAVTSLITPRDVLEASAATAFVFSSACYVGQATAPVAMLGYFNLLDLLTPSHQFKVPAVASAQ
ncbi:MAG: hypothetical protein WCK65_00715 [Rhodospirillaceae bacterium]